MIAMNIAEKKAAGIPIGLQADQCGRIFVRLDAHREGKRSPGCSGKAVSICFPFAKHHARRPQQAVADMDRSGARRLMPDDFQRTDFGRMKGNSKDKKDERQKMGTTVHG
ncbi:MAG: hypothetical protein BWY83_02556 [bacterium ADurb.Bin478]|nr:MAG: hypothetical protein BWY83_02556 [bacterium ADurb.Bin478]